jgi:hypothetical protein
MPASFHLANIVSRLLNATESAQLEVGKMGVERVAVGLHESGESKTRTLQRKRCVREPELLEGVLRLGRIRRYL